ncbi:hypothetical protein SAMN06295974_2072 [Plantibacter flavus]|uniref:O-antigen ligase n=1 Tax=Plantibacter flavus TaxID=150123 RepID=A0A3N2BZU4_9MICO|nr:hypothetical protein [Plantibacter flavus]ROR80763.1 hypothetical protein EDD42_0806 [Plantibacter flavus]SMG31416.1 hypothetical protein SAMN06295974_2072 [Plantibacter flavus]
MTAGTTPAPVRRTLLTPAVTRLPETRASWLDRAAAAAVPVVLALSISLPQGLKLGYLVVLLLVPVWLPVLGRFREARLFVVLGLAGVVGGALLTAFAAASQTTSQTLLVANSFMLLGLVAGTGALLWARTVLGAPTVAVWFGLGMVASIPLGSGLGSSNVWRFGLSLPVTVLLLALAWRWSSRLMEFIVIVIIGLIGALNDARSGSAMLVMTAALVVWQLRPSTPGRRGSTIRTLLGLGVLGALVYTVTQAVILGGYLGERALERTQDQINTSGNLIVGGRPEAAATIELLTDRPVGFGSGALPTLTDILNAKTGMSAIGYQPNNGYVENYMFGFGYEVHSVIGDLWIRFGLAGCAIAVLIFVLTFRALGDGLARRAASALMIWLTVRMLWNLLFSPLESSLLLTMLFLAIAFVPRRSVDTDRDVRIAGPEAPRPRRLPV